MRAIPMHRLLGRGALLALLAAACAPGTPGTDPAAEKAALMEADRVFARDTAAHGADGWADTFLPNGVMFPQAGVVEGRVAIRQRMQRAFAPERPRLTWEPTRADVSDSLGYTVGRWESKLPLPDGSDSTLARGNYVTIWRKTALGWKVALDIGNSDPEP